MLLHLLIEAMVTAKSIGYRVDIAHGELYTIIRLMYGETNQAEGRLDYVTEDITTHVPTAEFQTLGNLLGLVLYGQAL